MGVNCARRVQPYSCTYFAHSRGIPAFAHCCFNELKNGSLAISNGVVSHVVVPSELRTFVRSDGISRFTNRQTCVRFLLDVEQMFWFSRTSVRKRVLVDRKWVSYPGCTIKSLANRPREARSLRKYDGCSTKGRTRRIRRRLQRRPSGSSVAAGS